MKLSETRLYDIRNDVKFNGTRTLKNTVSQLAKNNKYSLTEPNQRYIKTSISELSKVAGEKTIEFLINIAGKLKYSTNISLKFTPLNDWKEILLNAASQVLRNTPSVDTDKYDSKIESIRNNGYCNKTEREIMSLRAKLLSLVDINQIKNETFGGIKDFKGNLDYLIVSSETTLKHKKYVLERLNYLMSDKYKINPQLADKKSIVAAELVNDMAIFTPGHKIPNIKAVDQKNHGMCGAISVVRKKVAYEDKPNYIDSILSELDDSTNITVYDRSKLGSGKKTSIVKPSIDFIAALSNGYRIIDASATMWMEISSHSGYSTESLLQYFPFDREHFDVKGDRFYNVPFQDPDLQSLQNYYQALLTANNEINDYKADKIRAEAYADVVKKERYINIKAINSVKLRLLDLIKSINSKLNDSSALEILNNLLDLEKRYSSDIDAGNHYEYIPNEEYSVKIDKIRRFLIKKGMNSRKLSKENLNRIYELVNAHHELEHDITNKRANKRDVNLVKTLYKIAASTKYQYLQGFENEEVLNAFMKDANIPHREECMQKLADSFLLKLKSGSADADRIILSLHDKSNGAVSDLEDACRLLESIKIEIDKIVNSGVDNIYNLINIPNKQVALLDYISTLKSAVVDGSDKNIADWADKFGVKKSAKSVIQTFDELLVGLESGAITYNSVFNLLGSSSQLAFLYNNVEKFFKYILTPEGGEILDNFVKANNLDPTNIVESIDSIHIEIVNRINNLNRYLQIYSHLLTLEDENGFVINSPEPSFMLIKKLENSNTLISDSVLNELQQDIESIYREESKNENELLIYESNENKSFSKFSKRELSALHLIEQNITQVSRYINKQLLSVRRAIGKQLDELNRKVGLNSGYWWINEEGHSGLLVGQEVRLLEYITGRPHYNTTNIGHAIKKIKATPYSGISSSSVYHDEIGMHAQYIADIAPVEIKTPGSSEPRTVEVLWNDNTWGPTELKSVWTDSQGLLRTDYCKNRGGKDGYITDNNYRNGNIVDKILHEMVIETTPDPVDNREYKRLRRDSDFIYRAPQYSSISLDGYSPDAFSIADSIYDSVLTPTSRLFEVIQKLVKKMKYTEVETLLYRMKAEKNNWEEINERLIHRILGDDNNPLIDTEEKYNQLPDNDMLKIVLEKAALMRNYPIYDYLDKMHGITNIKELGKFKKIQYMRAIREFSYSFGKNGAIIKYLAESITQDDLNKIKQGLTDEGINLSEKDFVDVFYKLKLDSDEFDGSIKNMIDILISHICTAINEKVNIDLTDTKFTKILREMYSRILYFNSSDIKNPNIINVIRFIDRVYNPSSDAELVRIYRRIQNMTNEEFKRQIVSQLTLEDVNIKNGTGYQLLKRIQRYDTSAENILMNTIYADESLKSEEPSQYTIKYSNHKLNRTPKVLSKYTFESAYKAMDEDLSLLTLPKLFNKYKEMNYTLYGVSPAYPKIDYMSEEMFNNIVKIFIDPIADGVDYIRVMQDLLEVYNISDKLEGFALKHDDSDILDKEQYKSINNLFGRISTLSNNDESAADINAAALDALELKQGVKFSEYRKYINTIVNLIAGYKKISPQKLVEEEIQVRKNLISKQAGMLVDVYIRTRYQNKFTGTLNKYKQSLIERKRDVNGVFLSDLYRAQLMKELKEYIVLQEPKEILDRYVKSLFADSELHKYSQSIEDLLKRALDFAKLYDVQITLMEAIKDGIETDVKSEFKNIQVELTDGTVQPMSSAKIVAMIAHKLLYENQQETALLFLDKLGLNESYVSYIAKEYFNYDEFKSLIEESVSKHKAYQDFTAVFNENYNITEEEIKSGADAIKSINRFRKKLSEAAKALSIEKSHLRIFTKAIDNCKVLWRENPENSKVGVYYSVFDPASSKYEMTLNKYFEPFNEMLTSYNEIRKLVNNVPLEVKSVAVNDRIEFNHKFEELVAYNNERMSHLQGNK